MDRAGGWGDGGGPFRWIASGSVSADRRGGRLLVAVAALGAVVAVLGTVVAWQFVGEVRRASRASIDVTLESLDAVEDTVDLAAAVIGSATSTLSDVETTLATVSASFAVGQDAFEQFDTFASDAAPALEDTLVAVRQLAAVGTSIDGLLAQLRALPIVPPGPVSSLGPSVAAVAAGLEPLPATLRSAAQALDRLQRSSNDLEARLRELATGVAAVNDRLGDTAPLLAGFRGTIDRARAAAGTARAAVVGDTTRIRVLVVAGGLGLASGQLAPLWLGCELLARARRRALSSQPGDDQERAP